VTFPADKIAVVGDPPVKGITFECKLTTVPVARFLIIYILPFVAGVKSNCVVEAPPVFTIEALLLEKSNR
jgi:hypothetical protein